MADSRKTTGIYYGEKFLDIVQLGAKNKPAKIIAVDGKAEGSLSTTVSDGSELSQGARQDVVQKLQLAFNKNNLSPNNVALSLPTKDIIFRSFVIPWMQSHEVKGVVDFEAGKYVPFPLAELSYSFYPLTITEGGNKRIRVTFVAIKKTELDKYVNMLDHANIRASYIEPSATSLIRTLVYKKILKLDATSAIVSKEGHAGKIIIVEQGVPQFVREFLLRVPGEQGAGGNDGEEALLNRLNNEIRISLDYFNRQNNQVQAKEIIFISDTDPVSAAQKLQEDMKLPTVAYTIASVLGHPEAKGLGSIHAYGVGLVRAGIDSATFNLAPDTKQGKAFKIGSFGSSKADYKQTALVAAITIGLSVLMIYGTSMLAGKPKKELAELEAQLSVWKDAAIPKLKQGSQEISEKVDLYKKIVIKTEVANILDHIPTLLPDGVWIDTMQIVYQDPVLKPVGGRRNRTQGEGGESSVIMTIEGFAYSNDKKQQFNIVDDFVNNIRESEEFNKYFTKIDSGGKTTQTIKNYTVTAFTITCE
ncbi:MAG: pilus assembly protein PilM [Candidatus Omnitrophica bacterium]|nr:pilus assembly protein PilM [Candidatus Omnitrophota bacterium]